MIKITRSVLTLVLFVFIVLVGVFYNLNRSSERVAGIKVSSNKENVRGIILPHHKLAENLILESFENLENENYSYVVIFGPNHFEPEINSLTTADSIFGNSVRNEILDKMLEEYPDIIVSSTLIENEHSVILPYTYLNNYFPEAKIIPFMVSPFFSGEDLDNKINYLVSNLPDNTLFIASVDFSHNTVLMEAMEKNQESIVAIENFDYQTIYNFKDDHLDSPVCIALLMKIMEKLNSTKWETWQNSHAALMKDDPGLRGTSYVIGVFR